MSSIANTLLAGAWIFSIAAPLFLLAGVIFEGIKDSRLLTSTKQAVMAKNNKLSRALAAIYGKPSALALLLFEAGLACFAKAIAYWAMSDAVVGLGWDGGVNYWGNQLGWVFTLFFVGLAAIAYFCHRGEWAFVVPYGLAAGAGALFVGTFAGTLNQVAFVVLSGGLVLLLVVAASVFAKNMCTYQIIGMVLFAVLFFFGYYLPYILSPVYTNNISTSSTLEWYLVADCVLVAWFIYAALTIMECSAVEKANLAEAEKCALMPNAGGGGSARAKNT